MAPGPGRAAIEAERQGVAYSHWLRWVHTAAGLVALGYLIVWLAGVVFRPWNLPRRAQEAGAMVVAAIAFALVRRRPRLAASLALGAIWAETTLSTVEMGRVLTVSIVAYPALVAVAALLLGTRASLVVAAASMVALAGGLSARQAWTGEVSFAPGDWYDFVVLGCVLAGLALLIRVALGSYRSALASAELAAARYGALFESLPDGVVVLDEEGRIEEVNPAAARLLGAEPGRLAGTVLAEALARAGAVRPVNLDAARPGAPVAVDLAGGAPRTLEITARAELAREGGRRTLLGVRDVSERRRMEERLQHTQRLELVGQLAGGVAHDLNNLLTAVAGNAALLGEHPDASVRELATEIEDARRLGSALVRQLLAFARRDVRRVETLDLGEAVTGMSRLLRRLLPETHRLEAACQGPVAVEVDRAQLEQVVLNLVTNARDAMPAGGTISVAVRALPAGEATALGSRLPAERQAVLEVADGGVGMPPEVQARMFEPFFTTKPRGQGTGLGLATVHGIVAQSGADIVVRSTAGEGTRIRLFLPLAAAAAAPSPPALRSSALASAGRGPLTRA